MEFAHAKLIAELIKDYDHLTDLLEEIKDGHNFSLTYYSPGGITKSRKLGDKEMSIFTEMAKKEARTALDRIDKFDEEKIPLVPPFYKD